MRAAAEKVNASNVNVNLSDVTGEKSARSGMI
jgi:hypothetical protein